MKHTSIMKYTIAVLFLIAVIANGLTGYRLFRSSEYDLSSLLIAGSYASIVGAIYFLTLRREPKFMS